MATLFEWLAAPTPSGALIDADIVRAAAAALSPRWPSAASRPPSITTMCSRTGPWFGGGTCSARRSAPPRTVGCDSARPRLDGPQREGRRTATGLRGRGPRGDPGRHRGGDRRPRPRLRLDAADRGRPCSPFSVTGELMRRPPSWPAARRTAAHASVGDAREEELCHEQFTPPRWSTWRAGLVGPDVWYAHGIHLDDAVDRQMAANGTGVAHCPSSNARLGVGNRAGRGHARGRYPVGLGVDGAASNEPAHCTKSCATPCSSRVPAGVRGR